MHRKASQTTIRIGPAMFRVLAVCSIMCGLALFFRDSNVMAERRITLTQPAPEAVPLTSDSLVRRGPAVEAAILAETPGRQEVHYRRGIAARTAIAYPLVDPATDTAWGYAVVPPTIAGRDAAEVAMASGVWTGLRHVPPALDIAARKALDLQPGAIALVLYDAPRDVVLLRSNRSAWHAVMFWLAAICFLGSQILVVEQTRLAAERRRHKVTRGWLADARTVAPPVSEKARRHFGQIAEEDEDTVEATSEPGKSAKRVGASWDLPNTLRRSLRLRGSDPS